MRLAAALGAAALVATGLVVVPSPAFADLAVDCTQVDGQTVYDEALATTEPSIPLEEMGVPEATARLQAMGRQPGAGVTVAVLDSGVGAAAGLPVVEAVAAGSLQPPSYYHGTVVAGLIAGPARADGQPVGIAPAAQILDVQVYDDPAAEVGDEQSPITEANIVAGLDAVLARVDTLNIKVVTIALALPFDSKDIKLRVARLWKRGAIVVAPTGNRPGEEGVSPIGDDYETHRPGEDVASLIHPADYKNVLAVNSSMTGMPDGTDPTSYVLENSATDVAAPTARGVSYAVVGGTCNLGVPATSWAAAEVSGALALLQSYYDESPARAVARLLNTANGRTDVPNTLVGAGDIQVMEALTRPLEMDDNGDVIGKGEVIDEPQQVSAPPEPKDLLASTRDNAVWWGLIGGGLLLLALVLRPVLARRRTSTSSL